MVEPNTTRPLALNLVTSMTSEFDRRFSMSLMRPSMKLCCSRAAWYSAFSLKSPWARASAIALMTFGRASLLSCFSSARSRSAPRRVIGVRFTPAFPCANPAADSLLYHPGDRARRSHRGVIGHLPGNRLAANRTGFAHRLLALGGVDDQRHLVVFYHIDDVRATLPHFVDPPAGHPGVFEHLGGATRGGNLEAAGDQHLREDSGTRLVAVAHANEAQAVGWQNPPGGRLRLGVGLAEGMSGTHHLAGGLHFRTQDGVGFGKFDEWEHRFLDREIRRYAFCGAILHGQCLARHDPRRNLGQGNA